MKSLEEIISKLEKKGATKIVLYVTENNAGDKIYRILYWLANTFCQTIIKR